MKKPNPGRTIILASCLLLQLSTLCFQARGGAGDVDLSFDPGSGINAGVDSIALQPDGKMIIVGGFSTVRDLVRSSLARLNVDGSGDSSFVPSGINYGGARAAALQSDGKLLVLGNYGDVRRLNVDGSSDDTWVPVFGLYDSSIATAIALQSDGKVLVGGTAYLCDYWDPEFGGCVSYSEFFFLHRLNTNGSRDYTFDGSGGNLRNILQQTDGKLLLIGDIDVSGTNRPLSRLNTNGSIDSTFDREVISGWLSCMALQPDGRILIGGDFTANGTGLHVARLTTNGSLDHTFNAGTNLSSVYSLLLQPDGKVLIGGDSLARLDANGSLDGSFHSGPVNGAVGSIALEANGTILIAGSFTTVNGTNRNRMARLGANGSLDGSFYPGRGLESQVYSLAVQPDGKVLIGGVRLNADGSLDGSYVPVPNTNFYPNINVPGTYYSVQQSSAVQADGKVLIGGYAYNELYDQDGGYVPVFSYFLFRFHPDGSRDTGFDPALGDPAYYYEESIRKLAVQPDGKILVGGTFNSIKGANRNGIARLNADGTLDNGFNPGFAGPVFALHVQPDGRVLVGNWSTLIRLYSDGSRDPCFNPSISGNNGVQEYSLLTQPDGRVLVVGSFAAVNGVSRNGIARLNENGSLDSTFDPGSGANGAVLAMALQPDGNVLIGGFFLTVNGITRPYVARLFGGSSGPRLRLFSTNSNAVVVAWQAPSTGFALQQNTDLATPNWVNVATTPTTVGLENQVALSPPATSRFFRLFSISTNTPLPPAPPAPAPILTAVAGEGIVVLSWTSLLGSTGHHLQRATNYDGPFTTIASPATASYNDTTVVNGTTYYYRVSVTYPCGESANSTPISARPHFMATVHVQSISMSFVPHGARYNTRAVVKVVDNTGSAVYGATVTGNFTGSINNAGRTGITAANGEAILTSSSTIKNGTVTFTVTGITTSTFDYNPGANVVSSATISR